MNALVRLLPRVPIGAAVAGACLALACQKAPRVLSPQDFEARLREQVAQRSFAAAESLLAERERRHPGDAEVYVGRGNLYFLMAHRGVSSAASVLPGTSTPQDSAGSAAATPDTQLVRRAIDVIREGIRRHPERLDIRFGLAFIHQQIGDPAGEIAALREAVDYAREHAAELRWLYGEPLPSPPDRYIPTALRDYVRFYSDRGAPGDEGPMLEIARLSAEAYPKSPQSANDVALYYGNHGDWKRSLEFLEQAEQADSTNPLVLYNLGWAHENLGHRSRALRYYTRATTAGDAGGKQDVAQSARDGLARLNGKTQ